MPRSWPGFAAPLVAALVTLVLVRGQDLILNQAANATEAVSPAFLLAGLLGLLVPVVLPPMWGMALALSRPMLLAPAVAMLWLAAALPLADDLVVWSLGSYVLAGLAAGWVLLARMRLDLALITVSLALAPYFIWSFQEVPLEEQYDQVIEQYIEARREMLAGTADPKQIELTLDAERRQQEQVVDLAMKILPGMFGLGLVGFAGLLVTLTWLASRLLGLGLGLARIPSFGKWRLPFYLVWLLVGSLGMFITRQPYLAEAGLNLALAVGTLLSLQGAAVQWEVTGRHMGSVPRVIYLLVAGFLFLPLVVLGLADQWLDFRKLERSGNGPTKEDDDGDKDSPVDATDDVGPGNE